MSVRSARRLIAWLRLVLAERVLDRPYTPEASGRLEMARQAWEAANE